jgi:hypothetical protein
MALKENANKRAKNTINAEIEIISMEETYAIFSINHPSGVNFKFKWDYSYGDDYFIILVESLCVKILKTLFNKKLS